MDKLHSVRTQSPALPEFTSAKSLCDNFPKYFLEKIETIRFKFPGIVLLFHQCKKTEIKRKMKVFERAKEDEIK